MTLTIQDIISHSKEHSPLGGKRTVYETDDHIISIVGGRQGLYGNFVDDFELAILDSKTKDFLTQNFVQGINDHVSPYTPSSKLLEIIKPLLENGFRVL